jgi:hypothetical protein
MMSDTTTSELLARLDALTARVEAQEAEIARLRGVPDVARRSGGVETDEASSISRRDLIIKGTAGLAVAALAAATSDIADAGTRTTVVADNTSSYGAAVTYPAGTDPAGFLPSLTGVTIGLVAASVNTAPVPANDSLLLGTANTLVGVQGLSRSAIGVFGQSTSAEALRGEIPAASASNTIAIYGLNNSSYAGATPGAGGFGVYGLSAKGHGLVGATASAGAAAVVGATNGVAGAYAAAFYGPVVVGGNFTVVGGAKSAAVKHPDGSHRLLYCVESPESWFEDFGKGTLDCGRAEVRIDPDFAAVANMENYHVFLTGYNGHLLHVTDVTPAGFTVHADTALADLNGRKESDLAGAFSWRIVARRKDIKGERLAPIVVPEEPALPSSAPLHVKGNDR